MTDEASRSFKPPETTNPKKRLKSILIVLVVIGAASAYVLLPLLTEVFVARPVRIEGSAMSPTLNNGDRVLFTKKLGTLERGDIVVFYNPEDTFKSFISRIVGLPGDRIDTDFEGYVTINSQILTEDYVDESRNRSARLRWYNVRPEQKEIKPGHYFMMGDNRDASVDSRYYGTVPANLIYGKYLFRYWASEAN